MAFAVNLATHGDYRLAWKVQRGYYDLTPAGLRFLSDEECDWWEGLKGAWLSTRPHWTTKRPEARPMKIVLLPLGESGMHYEWPLDAAVADEVAASLGVRTLDCPPSEGFDIFGRPVYRSELELKRLFGLLPPPPPGRADKDDVRARVSLIEAIAAYTTVRRTGRDRAVALCCFHSERTPSLSIDDRKKLWVCHGCGAGGDLFSFLMRKLDLSFKDAVEEAARIG